MASITCKNCGAASSKEYLVVADKGIGAAEPWPRHGAITRARALHQQDPGRTPHFYKDGLCRDCATVIAGTTTEQMTPRSAERLFRGGYMETRKGFHGRVGKRVHPASQVANMFSWSGYRL